MFRFWKPRCVIASVCFCAASIFGEGAAQGQQPCSAMPEIKIAGAAANMFSVEQERLLGEIEAKEVEKAYPSVHDEGLEAHLNEVANRLATAERGDPRTLQVTLLDAPEANAFSAGSGRIYVTRKLVALLKNDDELAAVLGHELGHIELHQNAITVSRLFREILRTTSAGGRKDIAEKFGQMMSTIDQNPKMLRKATHIIEWENSISEFAADRFAMYASSRAGFSPQAVVQVLARTARTKGNESNLLGDFGGNNANDVRVKEANKVLKRLPRSCQAVVGADQGVFRSWQAAVHSYGEPGTR